MFKYTFCNLKLSNFLKINYKSGKNQDLKSLALITILKSYFIP